MRKFDSINVIPFIDIMLVLLAIVLTTATFVSSGQLDIALPEASTTADSSDSDNIEIALDRDENLFLDGAPVSAEILKQELELKSADSHVRLMIDETVEFRRFVALIDLLKELSLDDVSIVTRRTD